jgi:hypothetical protein
VIQRSEGKGHHDPTLVLMDLRGQRPSETVRTGCFRTYDIVETKIQGPYEKKVYFMDKVKLFFVESLDLRFYARFCEDIYARKRYKILFSLKLLSQKLTKSSSRETKVTWKRVFSSSGLHGSLVTVEEPCPHGCLVRRSTK